MIRTAAAFIISVVVHVAIVCGIAMPVPVSSHPEQIIIQITHTEIPANETVQEESPVKDEIQSRPEMQESRTPEFSSEEIPPVVSETSRPTEEIEPDPGDTAGIAAGQESGDYESQGTAGQGSQDGNSTGQGNGEPSQAVTDGGDTQGNSVGENQPGPDLDAIRADYRQRVLGAIEAGKIYPQAARRLRQEGRVAVRFTVASDGTVSGFTVVSSSGINALDAAARDAVLSASPVPPIPEELGVPSLVLSLQIVFSLD